MKTLLASYRWWLVGPCQSVELAHFYKMEYI